MVHKPEQALQQDLQEVAGQAAAGSRWQHYKDPEHCYTVLGYGIDETTDEPGILYQAEYGEHLPFFRSRRIFSARLQWTAKRCRALRSLKTKRG
jgi:hypothetical protein